MMTLIIGGAGSGKSEYAEQCLDSVKGEKIYLATMIVSDREGIERVRRHRMLRSGKNFRTVEVPSGFPEAVSALPEDAAVLLEGIGTLAANELFCGSLKKDGNGTDDPGGMPDASAAKRRILKGIRHLASHSGELVIVSDEVNRAGCDYEGDTELYQRLVGELNQELGRCADRVVEMVCGCPVVKKDKPGSETG